MRRITRIAIGGVAGVVAAALVASVVLVSRSDRVIVAAVGQSGPKAVGTELALGGVDFSLRGARATLRGFSARTVEGFDTPEAVTLGTVVVGMDALAGNVPGRDEVVVEGGDVYAEERGRATNLDVMLERMRAPDESDDGAVPQR